MYSYKRRFFIKDASFFLQTEREKQKSERELESIKRRSMHKDTAAKRIMRESLGGTSPGKRVRLTRGINTTI